jgi:hypothetical protein
LPILTGRYMRSSFIKRLLNSRNPKSQIPNFNIQWPNPAQPEPYKIL